MSERDQADKLRAKYKRAVDVIDSYIDALVIAESSKTTIATLRGIVTHLRGLHELAIGEIISANRLAPSKRPKAVVPKIDEATLASMSLSAVEVLVSEPDTSLENLRRLAASRFGFTPGLLSRLSRKDLIQKISEAVENERTHETIARLAGEPATRPPVK